MLAFVTVVIVAPLSGASTPQAAQVPVPDGRYGAVVASTSSSRSDCLPGVPTCYGPQALVMFTVRSRKIVNPRVMVLVTCRKPDGTTQELMFGPTSNNPARTSPIPRNGSGSIAWVEDFDSSLISEATVTMNYTFRRGRNALASVDVRSTGGDTCDGFQNFRLGDASGIPNSIFDPVP